MTKKRLSTAILLTLSLSLTACSAKPSADTVETSTEIQEETGASVTDADTSSNDADTSIDADEKSKTGEATEPSTEEETLTESEEEESTEEETEASPESKTNAASEEEEEEEIEEESTNSKTSEKDSTKSETTTSETTTEAVTVQSVSAVVSGTHYVGETLTGADFTVTVTMSDGSTKTNPAGWSANPLTLSSTSNLITVAYQGASITITVPASVQTAGTGSTTGSAAGTTATTTTAAATTVATATTTAAATTAATTKVYSFDSVGLELAYLTWGDESTATGLTSLTPSGFFLRRKDTADVWFKLGETIDIGDYDAYLSYSVDDEKGGAANYYMTDSMKSKIKLSTYTVSSFDETTVTATYEDMTFNFTVYAHEGLLDISYAKEAFDIMNGYRAEGGLDPWVWSDEAYEVACKRAEELSVDYSHAYWHGWGENIVYFTIADSVGTAALADVATRAMTLWRNSAGHYATMMSTFHDGVYDSYDSAVAFYKKGSAVYGVTIFVN